MWLWSPSSSSRRWPRIRAIASSACSSGMPNFDASWPVAIASWVEAPTPGLMRSRTCWGRVASRSSRSMSSNESTTISPIPASRAARRSSSVFALPCSRIRSGGIPPRSASRSSFAADDVAAEALGGEDRGDAGGGERLEGEMDVDPAVQAGEGGDVGACRVPDPGLVHHEGRCPVPLGEVRERDASDVEPAVGGRLGGRGKQPGGERVGEEPRCGGR